jgi:hypothetical protein
MKTSPSISPSLEARLNALLMSMLLSAATFFAVLAPAPAEARSSAPYYTAELAQPASETKIVAGGVAWRCEGTVCVAKKGSSRPMRMCRQLKRKTGEIVSFTSRNEPLAEERLARCNG